MRFFFASVVVVAAATVQAEQAKHVDCPQQWVDDIEAAQPPAGRDPNAVNGWVLKHDLASDYVKIMYETLGWPLADPVLASNPPEDISEPGAWTLLYEPTDEKQVAERNAAARVRDALVKAGFFDRLAALPSVMRSVRPKEPDRPLFDAELLDSSRMREIVGLQCVRLHEAARREDDLGYAKVVEETLALARLCAFEPTCLSRIASVTYVNQVLVQIRNDVSNGLLSEQAMRATLQAVTRQMDLFPKWKLTFQTERTFALDAMQRAYGSIDPNAVLAAKDIDRLNLIGMLGGLMGEDAPKLQTFKQTLAELNAYYTPLIELADQPHRLRITKCKDKFPDADAVVSGNSLLGMVLISYGRVLRQADGEALGTSAIKTLLAIEIYRAQHNGTPPPNLDALVPNYLPALPEDPVAPSGRLSYRVLAPKSDDAGRSYLLYSVGYDGEDNGGLAADHDQVFPGSNVPAGTDVIVNLPRNIGDDMSH